MRAKTRTAGVPSESDLEGLHHASFGWALACCRFDREEAQDVLQTAYLKVLDGRARFDGRSSLKTWLFTVIRRTAGECRRQRWHSARLLARWVERRPRPATPDPEALAGGSEVSRRLRGALRELPSRQRALLHLVFYQELTVEEAAAVLGISVGSSRRHYHRGKERLRRRLEDMA